jgi:UDP-N-acetylmuramyl pentapeptide synthase
MVRAGDLVLVKGSRGVRTERVVERLVANFPV